MSTSPEGREGVRMIEVSHVSAGYGGQDVLKDLSFLLPQAVRLQSAKMTANRQQNHCFHRFFKQKPPPFSVPKMGKLKKIIQV